MTFAFDSNVFDPSIFDAGAVASGDSTTTIDAALPGLGGAVHSFQAQRSAVAGALPTLSGAVASIYFSDTARPTVSSIRVIEQVAVPAPVGTTLRWVDASTAYVAVRARCQRAVRRPASWPLGWRSAIFVPVSRQGRYQEAARRDGVPSELRYQDSVPASLRRGGRYQEATPRDGTGIDIAFQQGLPSWRGVADVRFQQGIPVGIGAESGFANGVAVAVVVRNRYQDAYAVLAGVSERPVHPPGPVDPEPGETIVVPIRRVYVVENHIALQRVDTGAVIEADAFAMSLDFQSWTWQWSASLPASALSLIAPGVDGDPVQLLATVNGVAYRLTAEGYSRERSFAQARVRVQGRGRAAELDAPYAPVLNHASAGDLTARQLMDRALTINGVGIGWDVDFGLEDWTVPGGTWSFQGNYINAVLDIAQAAGGYVQPHRTDATLRILPRYPLMPHQWSDLTPDFEIPADVASVEGIEWKTLPAYSSVHIFGTTSAGVGRQVVRAGSASDIEAQQITHPLITNSIAARQRGLAELSNTGRQAMVSLRMPVLAETGIIQPGALVRYVDGSTTRLGLVRSTALSWQRPVLRQTIGIETHLD